MNRGKAAHQTKCCTRNSAYVIACVWWIRRHTCKRDGNINTGARRSGECWNATEWCSFYELCSSCVCAASPSPPLPSTLSWLCCVCDSRQRGHSCGAGGPLHPQTGACRHKENKPGKMPDQHGWAIGEYNKYGHIILCVIVPLSNATTSPVTCIIPIALCKFNTPKRL